jgi:hypothetical protein
LEAGSGVAKIRETVRNAILDSAGGHAAGDQRFADGNVPGQDVAIGGRNHEAGSLYIGRGRLILSSSLLKNGTPPRIAD